MVEIGSLHEPERHVVDPALGLDCRIAGHAPVQAEGRLQGHPLYFRARHEGWSFTLGLSGDHDPADLAPGPASGFFRDGDLLGYELAGDYGTDSEASYMPFAVAEAIIRDCAAQYLQDRERGVPVSA